MQLKIDTERERLIRSIDWWYQKAIYKIGYWKRYLRIQGEISVSILNGSYYSKITPTLLPYEKNPRYTKDSKHKAGLVNIPGTVNIRLQQCSFQWVFQYSDLKKKSSTCLNYYFPSGKKFKSVKCCWNQGDLYTSIHIFKLTPYRVKH